MKISLRTMTLIICGLLITACGGDEPPKKANNPLADQQQLIRDAKKVQGILDADTARKKKALEDSN